MSYDVVVIGAGAGGEAAGSQSAQLGRKVAVVERDLVGGLCSFWACLPSKTLLDAASRRAVGAEYPWKRASARRDWMISREGIPRSDDAGHVRDLESAGAEVIRGSARLVGPRTVEVRRDGERPSTLETEALILAVGSAPVVPSIEGLDAAGYWTSNDATSTRELPSSLVILGGGVVGVELAQVYARFGTPTTLIQGSERILPRDHPRSSAAVAAQLREEGVDIRTNVPATAVARGGAGRRVTLSDETVVEGAELLVAVGRRAADLGALGAAETGITLDDRGRASPDERMAVGDRVFVAGDCAGGAQFTHVADYEGRIAARAAAGQEVRADLATIPAVVDRERRVLVGSFAACPGAGELIHEPALAIKGRVPVDVLADTIHAFPTAARAFGNLMAEARDRCDAEE